MEQERGEVSLRQLLTLVFCGLLSPLLRQVPRQSALWGGAGGWLGPLLALPVFLLALWPLTACLRRLPRGTGLRELYQIAFGRRLGRLAGLVTAAWLLALTAVGLRFYAEDFVCSIYPDTSLWLFLIALMALVWWVSSRGIGTVCRMSQIFFYGLCAVVGLVMLLGIPEVDACQLWPFWLNGWRGAAGSAFPVLAVLGHSIPVLLRRDTLSNTRGGLGLTATWFASLCLVLSALEAIMIGVFSWQTVVRMQMPFFSLAKEGSVLNIVERLESVAAGVWVFSDLALFAAQLLAAERLCRGERRRIGSRWILGGMSAAAAALAAWISPGRFQLRHLWEDTLQRWEWAVCYALPLLACVVILLRQRKQKENEHKIWGEEQTETP